MAEYNSQPLNTGTSLAELIRRPELNYDVLAPIDPERPELTEDVREQVNINIKYDGYIKRQIKQVKQFKKLESKKLPPNFDYNQISGLRMEAQQKLNLYQPISIGQASVFRVCPGGHFCHFSIFGTITLSAEKRTRTG